MAARDAPPLAEPARARVVVSRRIVLVEFELHAVVVAVVVVREHQVRPPANTADVAPNQESEGGGDGGEVTGGEGKGRDGGCTQRKTVSTFCGVILLRCVNIKGPHHKRSGISKRKPKQQQQAIGDGQQRSAGETGNGGMLVDKPSLL